MLIIPLILAGCAKVKEVEIPQEKEGLHEVVFHAGWDQETRTVLQEDGSVWWSPGDEISLFVGDGYNGGYKLTATNTEPAAKADFVGQIGDKPENASYIAVYPYSESTRVSEGNIYFTIPSEQIAKEGTFENGSFVSYAVSDDESLLFHNLCGGIKFSVAHEGIKKVEITTTGANVLAGDMGLWSDGVIRNSQGSRTITVIAPDVYFEVGKSYYAVVAASEEYSDEGHSIKVSFYTDETVATAYLPGCRFQRSVFKRLYEADKELKFKKYFDKIAFLPYDYLPEGVDKTVITEAYFHVSDPKTTDIVVSAGGDDSEPIYFEMIGTEAHFYTEGQAYKCYNVNFEGWKSLRSLDLSMFDVSDLQRFYPAFQDCRSLQSIDLSSFDTSNCIDFGGMFFNCKSLKDVDITNFDTSKAVYMGSMFENCSSIEELDVSELDLSSVAITSNMFSGCLSLKHLDVSKFDVSNVTQMNYMFSYCSSLQYLDVSSWDTSSCADFDSMFFNCSSLKNLDVSSWDTSSCTRVNSMFSGCNSLETLDVSHFNTANVEDFNSMFTKCWNLQIIDVSDWNMSKAGYTRSMFADCKKLREVDLSGCEFGELIMTDAMFMNCSSLETVEFPISGTPKLQNMENMFYGCSSLISISFNGLTTSNVTTMKQLFTACSSLKSLELASFETAQVTSMYGMFMGCSSLKKLDLSNFDTRNVSDIDFMFSNCFNLSDLNLSSFTTTGIEHAVGLLEAVGNLSRFDLGNNDWSSVDLSGAFYSVANRTTQCHIRCSVDTKNKMISIREDMGTDPKFVWYAPEDSFPETVDGRDPDLYYSSDFSTDRTVLVKQRATAGKGIDIVIMGDGFSDRLIADGTYDRAMDSVIDVIFAEEPYKSFKNLFNVYVVYAVSENEVIGKNTAFMSYDSRVSWAGSIGAYDETKAWAYASSASRNGDAREVTPIMVLNSPISDGAVWTVTTHASIEEYAQDPNWDDYHGGESFAYISGPFNSDIFYTTIHEIGHAFGKLADEYTKGLEALDEGTRSIWEPLCIYGMYKNIDFTGDRNVIKWKHFLDDTRYSGTGLGCYEGAAGFNHGVWRPTENGIMRDDFNGHYNAPSREAIYYRIHKLAYGKDWEYNFEDFVQWDLQNIQPASQTPAKHVPYPARMERKHIFKAEESTIPDGRKRVTIVMD